MEEVGCVYTIKRRNKMPVKKLTNKQKLIREVLNDMKSDICNYEEVLFNLAEVGLKKWTIHELKIFLGLEEE